MIDIRGADYRLRWPQPFFVQQLGALLARHRHDKQRVELLLEHAFASPGPLDDF